LLLSGATRVQQRGREIFAQAGGAIITTDADPAIASRYDTGSFVSIAVTRSKMAELVPDLGSAFGTSIPKGSEASQLLARYADAVLRSESLGAPALAQAAANHLTDLVALAIGARADAMDQARQRGLAVARLTSIKSTICLNVCDPELSVAKVAAHHGLTPRYVHKLFEREGTTFTAFVLERRLHRARKMLENPNYLTHTVAAIAIDCGFNDLSYFNRTFRRAWQATPSEIRDAALRQVALRSEARQPRA
jgi:AraC-like DNA-binding protein